jgi:anti-sigma factor RsiW
MPTNYTSKNQFDPGDPDENDEALWELLSVYADGEATPEEAQKVEALLRSDPAYAREFEFMRQTSASVQSYVELEPPAALRDAIFAATIRKQTFATRLGLAWDNLRRSLVPRYVVPLAGVAAAALIALAIWPTHTISTHSNPPPAAISAALSPGADPILAPKVSGSDTVATIRVSHRIAALAPQVRAIRPAQASGPDTLLVGTTSPGRSKLVNNTTGEGHRRSPNPIHEDGDATAVAYTPNMDAQNQRPSVSAPVPPSEAGDGVDNVKFAEVVPTKSVATPKQDSGSVAVASSVEHPKIKVMVANLTQPSVPPDTNQIRTKKDFQQSQTVLTDGYDRSTLRSIEKKEANIPFYKGSF